MMRPATVSMTSILPGRRRSFFDNGRRIQIDDADLGGQNDRIILSNVIAGRPQAVAVQSGADSASVGKGHGAGPSHASIRELWYSKKAFRSGSIWGFLPHGSGIIIITACGRLRPDMTRNSRQLSNIPESEPVSSMIGMISLILLPQRLLRTSFGGRASS